jgi:hypothetical protein
MKCFQCKKNILDESVSVHIGDGDFVHTECEKKYENEKGEFFKNVGDDNWYNEWLIKSE